jgi:hypothetical protein
VGKDTQADLTLAPERPFSISNPTQAAVAMCLLNFWAMDLLQIHSSSEAAVKLLKPLSALSPKVRQAPRAYSLPR